MTSPISGLEQRVEKCFSPISAHERLDLTLSYMGKTVTKINRFQMGENKAINSFIHRGYGYLILGTEIFAR